MKIKQYKSLKEAIEDMTKESENYVFVRHTLDAGEEIKLHYHSKANEFVVIGNGKFTVILGDKERTFNLKNQTVVIPFPKRKKHSLLAQTKISYFVFRDVDDVTTYC